MTERIPVRRLLGLILLAALLLRLWGCFGQGYPYSFYDDEKANVQHALRFGARMTLDPDWFNKPALGYYILFGEYGLYYLVGGFENPEAFAQAYVSSAGPFYLIGRISTTIFGVLTILLTYSLARSLHGRRAGLLAALALTFTPGAVASCQEVKMDVPAAFFTVAAAIYLLRILQQGRMRDYFLGGATIGLGIATKYVPGALIVPLVFAHVFRAPAARAACARVFISPRLYWGLGAVLGGFFIGSPYNFLNPKAHDWLLSHFGIAGQRFGFGSVFEAVVPAVRGPMAEGSLGESIVGILSCLTSGEGMGILLSGLAGVGVAAALWQRGRRDGLLLVTTASIILFIALFSRLYAQPRHLNLLYPFVAILAGRGLLFLGGLTRSRFLLAGLRPLGILLALLIIPLPGWPARTVVEHDLRQAAEDPRLAFKNWFEKIVPSGATVINDFGRIPLAPSAQRCAWVLERIKFLRGLKLLSEEQTATYTRFWEVKRITAEAGTEGPTYDTIDLVHDWQVEDLRERLQGSGPYNNLWPASPWGWLMRRVLHQAEKGSTLSALDAAGARAAFAADLRPRDRSLAPVELWTRPTRATALFFVERRRVARWLITTRLTSENYQSAHKRANFPDFAEFYDDLRDHYDCREFNGQDPDPARVVRLYDLSRRVERGRVTKAP